MSDHSELKRLAEAVCIEDQKDQFALLDEAQANAYSNLLADYEAAANPVAVLALIAENDRIKARLCVCRDCGGQGEIYSGHSSYHGHNQPPEPDMDVCGTCGGDGVLGPLEDFEALAAERDQLKAENKRLAELLECAQGDLKQAMQIIEKNGTLGFGDAFYQVAERLGITGARPVSPMQVFETEVLPALDAVIKDAERYRYASKNLIDLGSWSDEDVDAAMSKEVKQ